VSTSILGCTQSRAVGIGAWWERDSQSGFLPTDDVEKPEHPLRILSGEINGRTICGRESRLDLERLFDTVCDGPRLPKLLSECMYVHRDIHEIDGLMDGRLTARRRPIR